MIVSANYRPQQLEFSHFDGYWQPTGRFFRIQKLLSQKEKWDIEELKKIQTDDIVPIADRVVPKMLAGLKPIELFNIPLLFLTK